MITESDGYLLGTIFILLHDAPGTEYSPEYIKTKCCPQKSYCSWELTTEQPAKMIGLPVVRFLCVFFIALSASSVNGQTGESDYVTSLKWLYTGGWFRPTVSKFFGGLLSNSVAPSLFRVIFTSVCLVTLYVSALVLFRAIYGSGTF